MLRRLLIGILKGLLVGGAVGAGLHFGVLERGTIDSALVNYPLYGAVGALAGITAGKPFWRQGAGIEAILRSIFGVAVGCGLYALAAAFIGNVPFELPGVTGNPQFAHVPLLFAPTLALIYASLVELDNDGKAEEVAPSRVRVVDVDDIKVDEEEEAPARGAGKATKRR